MQDIWRGSVNAWECDEMHHMNTRFYVARSMEGLAVLFASLGMPGIFAAASATTVSIQEMHIRFLREARAATPLHMTGSIVAISSCDAEVLLMLHHSLTGVCAATFRLRVAHVRSDDGRSPVAWPDGFAAKAASALGEIPREAEPRSVGSGPVEFSASRERVESLGLTRISLRSLTADGCDAFGRMDPPRFIGSVSDGVRQLTQPLRDIVVAHSDAMPTNYGGAALEFRILHVDWPVCGDCFEIRSGFQKVDGNAFSIIHWMMDPFTGRHFGSMQSVVVVFDIDQRRIVPITEAARAALAAHAIPDLRL